MLTLFLAPMEGMVDWVIRDLLTEIGGIDFCTTEFLRINDTLLPDKLFYRVMPELHTESKTRSGTPVFLQLLGGHPQPLAENALRAVQLGACGIDLNFGCPAKTVNRHDGGATLLKYPDRIFNIVQCLRKNLPAHIPLTVKIRLGFDDPKMCLANAQAAALGGASRLTVHCRTKLDLYKPPAYWDWIPKITELISIPVVANGEIWSLADLAECRQVSGTELLMIGRGALAHPTIFSDAKALQDQAGFFDSQVPQWESRRKLLSRFFQASSDYRSPFYAQAKTKQWLVQLKRHHVEADEIFQRVKAETDPKVFESKIQAFCL